MEECEDLGVWEEDDKFYQMAHTVFSQGEVCFVSILAAELECAGQ